MKLHSSGNIVHADIKLENVLLCTDVKDLKDQTKELQEPIVGNLKIFKDANGNLFTRNNANLP